MDGDNDNLKVLPEHRLKALVAETEETLAELKAEMGRREEAAQHREIEGLEGHLENAQLSLQTIKDFFRYLVEDMRKKG